MTLTLMAQQDAGERLNVQDLTDEQADQIVRTLHDALRFDLLHRCPWKEMTLSARAGHVLETNQIDTLEALLRLTPTRLRGLRRCGQHTCDEIQAELALLGLGLKKEHVAP